ncbi:hypothetical protein FE783_00725 [Paenibacillus mesophilus]|uniref:glycosyl hydrolase family 28-related protein n=1 Tax=Paenibacillus mesophilus TaxID=2582849 RepID=UPI00110E1ED8|nr:glycosyl hydrolase family 28-related protein [Paenibacillus mesophilus]TMV52753.1 hypothetical protein FE783_00725 [Paenibacillus mesophilus]
MDTKLSRRKLLSSLGAAGAALAVGAYLSGGRPGFAAGGNMTVTGSVYGEGCNDARNCLIPVTMEELRALAAPDPVDLFYVTNRGREGVFYYDASDTASTDNSGTVLVSSSGPRFKRVFDGAIDVKWFGARGDGSTDDTAAIRLAIAALRNGGSLYFPAGEYIIDSGCLLFRGLSNVTIFGDGASSWLHPSGQRTPTSKTFFHTTVAIDQCDNTEIKDLRIESKGENWGNTDAGPNTYGDPRANFAAEKGGHALLVTRCRFTKVTNIVGRLCGSVGVFYFSSCEDIVVRDCFANVNSLGYAMYAVDNWCAPAQQLRRTYSFIDCCGWNEPGYSSYSGKGGIVAEGDPSAILNITVQGGIFKNCIIGGDNKVFGCGISAVYTNAVVQNVTTDSCLVGYYAGTRGAISANTFHSITGCSFLNNKVSGVHMNFNGGNGEHHLHLQDTVIKSDSVSHWLGKGVDFRVDHTSGIANLSPLSGRLHMTNVSISGGEYGIFSMDQLDCLVHGSQINGLTHAVQCYGGGGYELNGSRLHADSGPVLYFRTANLTSSGGSSAERTIDISVTNNILNSGVDQSLMQIGGNAVNFKKLTVKQNTIKNGFLPLITGSESTVWDEKLYYTTAKIAALGLAGTNTFLDFRLPKDKYYGYTKMFSEAGAVFPIIGTANDYLGTRGRFLVYLAGDVRASFGANQICRLTRL